MKEVIIDGIVYVPKEADKDDNSTPPFKVGDWVIGPQSIWSGPHRISDDNDTYLDPNLDPYDCRLATPKEIETYLIAEAERRGFKGGVIAIDADDGLKSRLTTLEGYRPSYDSLNFNCVGIGNDFVSCNVYYKGKWAEISKEPRPLPKTVEELEDILTDWVDGFRRGTEDDLDKYVDKFIEEFR